MTSSMVDPLFDLAIVGGGIMGASAAWRASAAGLRVVLLESSPTPTHNRGSSHGFSRIIRKTYSDAVYARLMCAAWPLWNEASLAAGCGPLRAVGSSPLSLPLVNITGGLSLVEEGSRAHAGLLSAAAASSVPIRAVSATAARARWGLALPPGVVALEELGGSTGVAVGAGRCVAALQALAVGLGCDLRCGVEVDGVVAVEEGGLLARVALRGGGGVRARRVALCPGAWAGPLVSRVCRWELPLQPLLVSTGYYRARRAPGVEPLPVVIDWGATQVYSCPVTPGSEEAAAFGEDAVKFAVHAGVPTTADGRPFEAHAPTTVAPVGAWLQGHLPHADAEPLPGSVVTCLYTATPDEDFVLDTVPLWTGDGRSVHGLGFLCAGFSGHGFKFGPVVGEVVRMWALEAMVEEPVVGWDAGAASSAAMRRVEELLADAVAAGGGGESNGAPLLEKFRASRFGRPSGGGSCGGGGGAPAPA
jgi:glycine/D-amino acid oxidase-like deaminating enzyme